MPKLAKKVQKQAQNATVPDGQFPLLDPGKYIGRLSKVEARTSQAGNPVWNVEFDEITGLDGESYPGRQWYNLNLPIEEMPETYRPDDPDDVREKKWDQYQGLTLGRLKGFFEAFGYSLDSDTDEMIGERCVLQIGVGTIQRGPRTGQETNQVNNLFSLESQGIDEDDLDGGGSDDDF